MDINWNDFDSHLRAGVSEALDAAGIESMPAPRPEPVRAQAPVELDAALIAKGLGLEPARVPAMIEQRRITTLCERGTGADAGLLRFTFYYAGQRLRLVTDAQGQPVVPGRD